MIDNALLYIIRNKLIKHFLSIVKRNDYVANRKQSNKNMNKYKLLKLIQKYKKNKKIFKINEIIKIIRTYIETQSIELAWTKIKSL